MPGTGDGPAGTSRLVSASRRGRGGPTGPRSAQPSFGPTAVRLCRPRLCAGSFYSFFPPVAESAKEDLPPEVQNGDER